MPPLCLAAFAVNQIDPGAECLGRRAKINVRYFGRTARRCDPRRASRDRGKRERLRRRSGVDVKRPFRIAMAAVRDLGSGSAPSYRRRHMSSMVADSSHIGQIWTKGRQKVDFTGLPRIIRILSRIPPQGNDRQVKGGRGNFAFARFPLRDDERLRARSRRRRSRAAEHRFDRPGAQRCLPRTLGRRWPAESSEIRSFATNSSAPATDFDGEADLPRFDQSGDRADFAGDARPIRLRRTR